MTTPGMSTQSVLVRDSDTVLARAHREHLVDIGDVQLALTVQRLHGETDEVVALTLALALAAARRGSTCLDLERVETDLVDLVLLDSELDGTALTTARAELLDQLQLPGMDQWLQRLGASDLVGGLDAEPNSVPLRLVGELVYLERYWSSEEQVADLLATRQALAPPPVDEAVLESSIERHFQPTPTHPDQRPDPDQQLAVQRAVRSWTTVLAGGPGTGKTSTVAKVVASIADQHDRVLRVALAAPSGKAASRLSSSVQAHTLRTAEGGDYGQRIDYGSGMTLHSLLGSRGLTGEFRRGPQDPLEHDVVVVDEVSMVDLATFATLLSALRPQTRLVLVGDPQQLKAVSAGTVLADIVSSGMTLGGGASESAVTRLGTVHRHEGPIEQLAAAIRVRDADAALEVLWHENAEDSSDHAGAQLLPVELVRGMSWDTFPALACLVAQQWAEVIEQAERGDAALALAALDRHRVLCAHRNGLFGVSAWTRHTLELIRTTHPGFGVALEFHPGRPVMLRSNDPLLNLSNGDTGVVIGHERGVQVAIGDRDHHRIFSPGMLRQVEDVYAMTVHKAQGSQFDHVTVVLPPLGSALLTRDLVYTAITRASVGVRIIGTEEQLRTALATEARRTSGLASRWRHDQGVRGSR